MEYKSQSFKTRIELSLADVSSSPTDEFKLYKAYYDPNFFDCELCNHRNCAYAFEVQNLKTNKILKIGSQCIHHFKDRGVDIDLAEGLMKRIYKTTQNARNKLIREIGEDEYKQLSKKEKSHLITQQYMVNQAKELLSDLARNKSILSEDQVEYILRLGLKEEYEKAKNKQEKRKNRKKIRKDN